MRPKLRFCHLVGMPRKQRSHTVSHVHVKRENWSLQYRRAGISRRSEIPSPKTYDNDLLLMQMCSVLHTKRGFSTSVSTLFVEI